MMFPLNFEIFPTKGEKVEFFGKNPTVEKWRPLDPKFLDVSLEFDALFAMAMRKMTKIDRVTPFC